MYWRIEIIRVIKLALSLTLFNGFVIIANLKAKVYENSFAVAGSE